MFIVKRIQTNVKRDGLKIMLNGQRTGWNWTLNKSKKRIIRAFKISIRDKYIDSTT